MNHPHAAQLDAALAQLQTSVVEAFSNPKFDDFERKLQALCETHTVQLSPELSRHLQAMQTELDFMAARAVSVALQAERVGSESLHLDWLPSWRESVRSITRCREPLLPSRTPDMAAASPAPQPARDASGSLRAVPSNDEFRAKLEAVKRTLGPPPGFVKGKRGCWDEPAKFALAKQYRALREVCNYEGTLIELHGAWRYPKKANKNGGTLAKKITAACAWLEAIDGKRYEASLAPVSRAYA